MKDWLSSLCFKIGRIGRKQFFLYHLRIIAFMVILVIFIGSGIFLICGDGNDSIGCKSIVWLIENIYYIFILLFLLSNFYLAKRFQDCGICGIRAIVLPIIFFIVIPLVFGMLQSPNISPEAAVTNFASIFQLMIILYMVLLIIMCFEKGDIGPNKYGNPI